MDTQDLVTVAGNRVRVNRNAATPPNPANSYYNMLVTQGMDPETAKRTTAIVAGESAANAAVQTAAPAPVAVQSSQPGFAGATGPSGEAWTPTPENIAAWREMISGLINGASAAPAAGTTAAPLSASAAAPANGDTSPNDPEFPEYSQQQTAEFVRGNPNWRSDYARARAMATQINGAPPAARVEPAGAAGALNVPYGSAYYGPLLALMGQLFGLGAQKQSDQWRGLAELQAKPLSAAEAAFRRAGLGLDPFSGRGSALDIAEIIASPTSGGTGVDSVDFGNGQKITLPTTLTGKQLKQLEGAPNTAGVVESFGTAAGNPDIIRRSIRALMPAMFGQGAVGQGTSYGLGGGTGI